VTPTKWTATGTFLVKALVISMSGVLAPGPMTAAAVAAGTRGGHAGAMLALGHAAVEMPLMVLIVLGAGKLLRRAGVKIGIGLAGGVVLLLLGGQMLRDVWQPMAAAEASNGRHPFVSGLALSAANPYFLLWWATVGLALAAEASSLGVLAFVIFAVVHWLCDLFWLEALSLASFKGSRLLGPTSQKAVLAVCGAALVGFAVWFLYDASARLLRRSPGPF